MDKIHIGILKKFQALNGKLIIGKEGIKGYNSENRLPPDEFVPTSHIMHDLIRGFYKPANKPYLLSYQATESDENYGKQIFWEEPGYKFKRIEMHPPNGERDNRKKSDIAAARYNLKNNIPFGILHKIKKGQNRVLGLGMITSERNDGVFIVKPYSFVDTLELESLKTNVEDEEINTDIILQSVQRRGQERFKQKLLLLNQECAICGLKDTTFLIASHIKPWKDSSNIERMDPKNGLLLCPNHDKLFDKGYISFSNNGEILISTLISMETFRKMQLSNNLKINIEKGMEVYLTWHRKFCFKK